MAAVTWKTRAVWASDQARAARRVENSEPLAGLIVRPPASGKARESSVLEADFFAEDVTSASMSLLTAWRCRPLRLFDARPRTKTARSVPAHDLDEGRLDGCASNAWAEPDVGLQKNRA